MTTLALVLFILLLPLCLFLIGLILLQGGAGDISSAFGGGGQLDSTLGVGAGRKMSKITGWLSGLFMAIVLLLSAQHAGDLVKAAGPSTKPAVLPIGNDGQPGPTAPVTPGAVPPASIAPPATTPVEQPTKPATQPAAPAAQPVAPVAPATQPTAPAPVEKPVEQPAAPAPVAAPAAQPGAPAAAPVPAPASAAQPAAPAPTAEKPAEQPAAPAAPAAPRSGIKLDEPAK